MKTKLLAALIGAACAVPAFAQSNVTIYGIADAGIQVGRNGDSPSVKLVSGIADGSRLGFKGLEDIGGGYKAIFTLESRLELNNGGQRNGNLSNNQGFFLTKGMVFPSFGSPALAGAAAQTLATVRGALQPQFNVNAGNALFDRTSQVGLITPVGAVLLGRQYTPVYEMYFATDPFEAGTGGTWAGIWGGAGGLLTKGSDIRADNSIQYRIQLPNGLSGSVMYGLRNYDGFNAKNLAAGAVTYKAGDLMLAGAYNHGTGVNGESAMITGLVGATYEMGNMKFFTSFVTEKNAHSTLVPAFNAAWDGQIAPALKAGGVPTTVLGAWTSSFKTNLAKNFTLDARAAMIGMHYRVGAGRIIGAIAHQDDRTSSNNDTSLYAIGYDHNLSKRTDIYTVLAYIKNQNDGQFIPGIAGGAAGFTKDPGQAGKTLQIGIRHRF